MSDILELSKKGVSATYRVLNGERGDRLAELKSDGSWVGGSVVIDGVAFTFRLEDQPDGDNGVSFTAAADGQVIATAQQLLGGGRRGYIVNDGTTILELEVHRIGQKPFEATINGAPAGSVALAGWAGRRALIDLPASVPLGLRLFAGWLALRNWNQAANVRIVST